MSSNEDPGDTQNSGVLDALLASISAEGLTASSLQQSLAAMDMRHDEILRALLQRTKAACSASTADNAATLTEEASCATAVASLADRGLTEESSTLAQAAAIASQHTKVVSQLQYVLTSLAEVGAVAELQQKLAEYDAMVAQGVFKDAANLILELQVSAGSVAGAEATAAAVEERLKLFKDYVITAPPQYMHIDPNTHLPILIPPAQQTGAALGQVWEAAAMLGTLSEALQHLSSSMVENCVNPILAADAAAAAAGPGVMESPAGSVASSALSAATTIRGGAAARAGVERALYRCFKSICDGALCGRPALAKSLGDTFWPAASDAYINFKLRPLKPLEDSELAAFMRAGSLAVKLEQKAVKLGLWPTDSEGPISKFVRQTVGKILSGKRIRYATSARDLLTSGAAKESTTVSGVASALVRLSSSASRALFGGAAVTGMAAAAAATELSGEPSIGDVGPYAVSRAAEGLVSLMNDALGEACRSGSAALAQAMCGAVVDLAALLLALDPAATEQERLMPYIAALRYNDCLHVYRALCMLPQAHAPRLQALVHPAVNFIAPAMRVRSAGEAALNAMVAHQQRELLEIARDLQKWRGLDGPGVIRCNKAARQVLAAFHRLGGVLGGVLPRSQFVTTVASLANAVCGSIADTILQMGDISEDESEQIPKVLGLLISPSEGILAQVANAVASAVAQGQISAAQGGDASTELTAAARDVARLREVCEMLDIPSREIAKRWRSGRLAAVGLTKEQVGDMVRALFEDNEFSRASLNAILQAP